MNGGIFCYSFVFMLMRPDCGLNILLNFTPGSEARKAYLHYDKRMLNLIAIIKQVFWKVTFEGHVLNLSKPNGGSSS